MKDNYLNALHEQFVTETNIKLVSAFEYISELFQSGLINQEEFQLGKQVMLTYNGKRRKDDYQESFLDAIPFLRKALQNRIIDNTQYHEAVHQTLKMKKEKFIAQLLFARLISYSDYKDSEKSNLVQLIVTDDLPSLVSR